MRVRYLFGRIVCGPDGPRGPEVLVVDMAEAGAELMSRAAFVSGLASHPNCPDRLTWRSSAGVALLSWPEAAQSDSAWEMFLERLDGEGFLLLSEDELSAPVKGALADPAHPLRFDRADFVALDVSCCPNGISLLWRGVAHGGEPFESDSYIVSSLPNWEKGFGDFATPAATVSSDQLESGPSAG